MRLVSPNWYRSCLLFAAWHLGSESLLAAIRPSFMLDYSSWDSTNIVAARTTPQAGLFVVDESWKGDLRPGDHILVSDLRPPSGAVPISSYPKTINPFGAVAEPFLQVPGQPPGSSVLLFLKRGKRSNGLTIAKDAGVLEREWEPANSFGEFKTSIAWIEAGQVYAFMQVMNPGDSLLTELGISPSKLRDRVAEIVRAQRNFDDVLRIQSGNARAARLKSFLHSDAVPARQAALAQLGHCGPAAILTIREMLDDPTLSQEAPEIVKAYVLAGGDEVSEDLNARLREELEFWRVTAPSLARGWWNETPIADALRNRYSITMELVVALQHTHYGDALSTATELRDFWRSLPQLNDPSGLDQMVEQCDRLIGHLRQD